MQKTIFDLLTNEEARTTQNIEASLDKEFSAGAPWFTKINTKLGSVSTE